MNSVSWNYRRDRRKENNSRQEEKIQKKEHTRLVIDEDSIYEIDLDCMECERKEEGNSF